MLLTDHTHQLALRPLRYEFPAARGDQYDDNWLVVEGTATTPERSWSFTEPCLLTDEARRISTWLRGVAAGTVAVTTPELSFLEPLLAFSLADRGEEGATIRVHLSLEAAPPGEPEIFQPSVEITLDGAALRAAADDWDRALAPFPPR
ncbi:hypothetical protein [Streptomyces sp. NPDC018693]|uniref:WapI family immunity protein n=1 Tax=unclassified Streptomyces TaxID=2593676 RepID=UPI0037B7C82B